MNDLNSLLLATTFLALGGLGIYMYKGQDDNKTQSGGEDTDYNEDNSWFSSKNEDDEDNSEYVVETKTRTRGGKTKRSRGKLSGTKRRY